MLARWEGKEAFLGMTSGQDLSLAYIDSRFTFPVHLVQDSTWHPSLSFRILFDIAHRLLYGYTAISPERLSILCFSLHIELDSHKKHHHSSRAVGRGKQGLVVSVLSFLCLDLCRPPQSLGASLPYSMCQFLASEGRSESNNGLQGLSFCFLLPMLWALCSCALCHLSPGCQVAFATACF